MGISFLFTSLLSSAICKASSDNHFAFLHFFSLGMVLITASCTMSQTQDPLNMLILQNKKSAKNSLQTQQLQQPGQRAKAGKCMTGGRGTWHPRDHAVWTLWSVSVGLRQPPCSWECRLLGSLGLNHLHHSVPSRMHSQQ